MLEISLSYGDLATQPLASAVPDPALVGSLDLSGNNLSKEMFIEIVDKYISGMANLTELDIKDNKIAPQGAEHLCNTLMKQCRKLKYLDLGENGILDESLLYVAHLLQELRIETLILLSNHLTHRGIPTLCDGICSSRHLQQLSLALNVLGDRGASMIAEALTGHPSLRILDISDNQIGDAGAASVARYLILPSNSRLESLNLSINCFGDVGFAAIAEAVEQTQSSRLVHLDLGASCRVGPAGRRALIKCVSSMRHLQSLDLCSCELSDEETRDLVVAVASRNCGITKLEWFNNPGMEQGTERALEEALEAKRAACRATAERWRRAKLLSGVLLGAALLGGVAVVLRRRRFR
ncbi:leucine-rich repeat protein [Trypanosoma conorhini]|uniref:Leucine-rich repeat protein n=1 Tax=Trypanosoma conorhini TaxID=83891 RepID=A0A422Q8A3_9TRYP|nr:leucine-rich repeat protein [Trypanosoma conorhini]RNF26157.1 leucine-rich repeat protein [Trypanosoma conorhini]